MTTQIEAMKSALAAMEHSQEVMLNECGIGYIDVRAITALRAAIEAAEKVEPYCWMLDGCTYPVKQTDLDDEPLEGQFPLYLNPPSAEIEELRKDAESANETFAQLIDWCRAYPVDVFIDPDWDDVKEKLGATLLTQVSAANFRHALKGVEQIIIRAQGLAMQEKQP